MRPYRFPIVIGAACASAAVAVTSDGATAAAETVEMKRLLCMLITLLPRNVV